MTEFTKYQHIERLGNSEVQGILDGVVYVYPKLDGTNAQIWSDDGLVHHFGSRRRELTLDNDNAGFMTTLLGPPRTTNDRYLLDMVLGYPGCRFHGEWLCLSGDTVIRKSSAGKNGAYMTLREMYQYANTPTKEKNHYMSKKHERDIYYSRTPWWKRHGYPCLFSLFQDRDVVEPNRMTDIVYTGDKCVYRITTRKGFVIKASEEHPFLTPSGFTPVKDLQPGSCVAVTYLRNYREVRTYGDGTNRILTVAADRVAEVGECELCGLGSCLEAHHRDRDHRNHDPANLQVLCVECHKGIHRHDKRFKGNSFQYEFDKVVSVEYVGIEDCYDITMSGGENSANFVAAGFIVHNCPHSLRTYTEDAWRRFYLFDITRYNPATERIEHVHYEALKDICDQYSFTDYIAPLRILVNPTVADCHKCLQENNYMIQDGAGVGEGVVLKNYAYWSKYGRQTWAKIVTSEFKDKNRKEMGAPITECRKLGEDKLANSLTCAMVDKVVANIEAECDGWSSKYIPRLIETVWRDFVTEELYNGLKKLKQHEQTVNFRTLRGLVSQRIRELKPELF